RTKSRTPQCFANPKRHIHPSTKLFRVPDVLPRLKTIAPRRRFQGRNAEEPCDAPCRCLPPSMADGGWWMADLRANPRVVAREAGPQNGMKSETWIPLRSPVPP